MKILVIDDTQIQRDHAIKALAKHEVTVANGWNDGKQKIEEGGWDVVLSDMSMPAVTDGQSDEGRRHVGEPTPYGFPLALLALKLGVPKVAIVSNGLNEDNHHSLPIFWANDVLYGSIIPERFWVFTGYKCPHMAKETLPNVENPRDVKDWDTVLKIILGEEKMDG